MTFDDSKIIEPMDFPDRPAPYATSALIIHESGLMLSVSRKYDFEDMGLPGGKLDPGEPFADACVRETLEETGLTVVMMRSVFADYCGNPVKHVVHWNQTFLCKTVGTLNTTEKGRVAWINPTRLIMKPNGEYNSFGDYNLRLFNRLMTLGPIFTPEWLSIIELDPSKVERHTVTNEYQINRGTSCFCKGG
jgi:8-oxo-dGTP pyrophosphatase MutT (NUDIX family)